MYSLRSSPLGLPALACLLALGSACSSAKAPAGQGVTVEVIPKSNQVLPLGTVAFQAAVTGTIDATVTWSLVEAAGGTIDDSGLYTAPQSPGTYHVKATSNADASVSGVGTVLVTLTPSGGGPTTVAATNALNAHWTVAGSPYLVTGNLVVPRGSLLTVDPGVQIIFQGPYYLLVRGQLIAEGAPDAKIIWTAANTTVGWRGIRIGEYPHTSGTPSSGNYVAAAQDDRTSPQRVNYNIFQHAHKTSPPGYWSGLPGENLYDQYQEDSGGALWVANVSDYQFTNNDFVDCTAGGSGGGSVHFATLDNLHYTPYESINNTYTNCRTLGTGHYNEGGGAVFWHTSPGVIAGGGFYNNSSGTAGGIFHWDGAITLYGVEFSGNTPDNYVGSLTVAAPPAPPVISSFTADHAAVASGESVTLSWGVTGAVNVAIDKSVGVVTGTSKIVKPTATTTYKLFATGLGGTRTASVTVTVTNP